MNEMHCPNCSNSSVRMVEKIDGIGYLHELKDDTLVVYGPHIDMLQHPAFSPDIKPPRILLRCTACHVVWPL